MQLQQIDYTSDKPIFFKDATNPETSPYSYQRDPTKKVVDSTVFVPVTDTIKKTDANGKTVLVKIRYMADNNEIEVEKQQAQGVSSKYGKVPFGEDKKSRSDVIVLEKGGLYVVPKQKPNLIEYLMTCNYNGSNPNRDSNKDILFYFTNEKLKADKDYGAVELQDKAKGLIAGLRGNYRKIQDVARVLKVDANMSETQLLLHFRMVAETNAQLIIDIIAEDKATIDLIVHKCEEYGLIEFTGTSYKYAGTDSMIKGFRGKQKPEIAFKALVAYLGDDEGNADLLSLQKLLKEKESRLQQNAVA